MMASFGLLFFMAYLVILVNTKMNNVKNDIRFISYQDLQLTFDKFAKDGVDTYSQMLFDVAGDQVFVGARDNLYKLSLPKLELLQSAAWPASEEKRVPCLEKGQNEKDCHNYVKVLLTNGRDIFTCGTFAFSPQCTWRDKDNISHVKEWIDGIAKAPYNPHANVTGLMSEDGEYYFGGPTDFSASDYLIARSIGKHSTIRTKQYNSMWLNEPQFVGSFETNNFVYFLFREAAVEYINCGKIVYSRIARICKNDGGGRIMLKDNWTTFVKARLNCSISGDYPFYFDEIQSTSYVPDENIVYASFTTPSNGIAGSAICAFNLTSIDAAFSGPFKYQEHTTSSWNKHYTQYPNHFECKGSVKSNHLLETSKYQLMDNAVQATTLSPLHVAETERFTHITVDVLATKLHAVVHVIYVATLDGLVKKINVLPRTQETCIVEIWQPVPHVSIPIINLQFLKNTNSLYVGTATGLMRIPAHHCRRHVSQDSCLNAMDPYCGWNELEDACTVAPQSDPLVKHWRQSVTSCPKLDAPVDGGWSSWSEWGPCTHRTHLDGDASDTCQCQTRTCNNPAPQNGGSPCGGESIAVTNCTVHGGWTPWSAWSACSATCGVALKTRSRSCTNPAPAHGGRVCVGPDHSEVFCAGNPPCPISTPEPQDGGWGEWKEWEQCSAQCNGGFRKRHRTCNNPSPKYGGSDCAGCNVEYDECNKHQCPEQRKQATWTPWLLYNNSSSEEYTERRYRFTCRGPVQDAAQLKVSTKEEVRICKDGLCLQTPQEADKWSAWSSWSECSAPCGGGVQNKTRYCEGRDCQGSSVQTKPCNAHPCQDEWVCWSDWSPCSASCGWGIRTRYKKCLGRDCDGPNRDEEPCENAPCESLLGWGNWSAWSLCDENMEQHRIRKCRTTKPNSQMCQGTNKETRICVRTAAGNEIEGKLVRAGLATGVVVSLVVVAFLSGIGGSLVLIYLYSKKKKNSIPSSPHYMSAKQNPYITLPLQDRPPKKQIASTSNNILNNVHNGTLKPKCYDYETATIKRNSHGLNNGHNKQELLADDKYLYD